jgi:hypothetical protein
LDEYEEMVLERPARNIVQKVQLFSAELFLAVVKLLYVCILLCWQHGVGFLVVTYVCMKTC